MQHVTDIHVQCSRIMPMPLYLPCNGKFCGINIRESGTSRESKIREAKPTKRLNGDILEHCVNFENK
jgi:hypothetical protein